MKQRLTVLLPALLLLLAITGCAAAPSAADQQLLQTLDALDRRLTSIEAALAAAPSGAVSPDAPAPGSPAPSDQDIPQTPEESVPTAPLTEEEAQKIALDHLGFTADQVERLRSHYEIDDRIPQYDVEFFQGDWEYEFEVHAETGKILSFDKDPKYD